MNIGWHAATGVPFLVTGHYMTALGCVIMDLTWVKNEIDFRRSGIKDWHEWSKQLQHKDILPYRIAHSLFFILPCGLFSVQLMIGMLIHLALDLPTHKGLMQQMPLYPIKWKWKWTPFC